MILAKVSFSMLAAGGFFYAMCKVIDMRDACLKRRRQRRARRCDIVDLNAYRSWRNAVKIYESTKITAERK